MISITNKKQNEWIVKLWPQFQNTLVLGVLKLARARRDDMGGGVGANKYWTFVLAKSRFIVDRDIT